MSPPRVTFEGANFWYIIFARDMLESQSKVLRTQILT